jgi:hypothetical protein
MPRIAQVLGSSIVLALAVAPSVSAGARGQAVLLDCNQLPPAAATMLPAPVEQWTRIDCRPFGQVLAQAPGWQWRYSGSFTQEVTVAAIMGPAAEEAGGARFFRDVLVSAHTGEDLLALDRVLKRDVASYAFLAGEETPRAAYTVRAINDLLDTVTVYFLERAQGQLWAVACTPQCLPENVFLVQKIGG